MNKKKIIQIAVIVVAFGASGLVLYNGFFKGQPQNIQPPIAAAVPGVGTALGGVPNTGAAVPAAQSDQDILPVGNSLNFGILQKQNLSPLDFDYPKLNPADIGIPEGSLINPSLSQ